MEITSSAFGSGGYIPAKYTCERENISPPLSIKNVPSEAQCLVLIADDPDAPMGTWVHWTVWNIVPSIENIEENTIPEGGIEGVTSFGSNGYGGPCPPSGIHRYFFKVYALDTVLALDASANIKGVENGMRGHIIDNAELVGLYTKKY